VKPFQPPIALATLLLLCAAAIGPAIAAPVTWIVGPTTTIDENDIDLVGTLVHAGTWGSPETTVTVSGEPILFEDRAVLTAGMTDGEIGVNGQDEVSVLAGFNPPGAIDPAFHEILDGFMYNSQPLNVTLTVTLDGLTPGQEYRLQLFVSDDRTCCGVVKHEWWDTIDGSGNNTVQFQSGASTYVIGSFTADAATQQVFMTTSAGNAHVLNAYVLRSVGGPVGVSPGGSPSPVGLRTAGRNPFRGSTELVWTQPARARTSLEVFGITGRRVATLVSGDRAAGTHRAAWRPGAPGSAPVPAGVYFARLSLDGVAAGSCRLILIR
jgi:hypothetical protein